MNERFARASTVARIDLAHEPDLLLGQLEVHPALREIVFDGRREIVDRRVMQVLVALARAHGGVVSRDDLIESCWDGVVVGEDAINACISRLRKAAEISGNVFSVETIPRVGYRLRVPDIAGAATSAASATPKRPIYRGLQSLDEEDAAIFFGRDAPIAQGLDALRRMRSGSAKSMFVILGASGAGKSSFLKAGLLALLKQDEENFLVLPVVRPERAALTGARGLAASLVGDSAGLNGRPDFARLFTSLRESVVVRHRAITETKGHSDAARPPTIVIPIDQAEELFASENTEAARVLKLLADIVHTDRDTVILATIRSDAFEKLQNAPSLAEVQLLPFSLARLPHGAFKEVIEGPARLANPKLMIEPSLTERLLSDLATGDALPLLAFTLERLWLRHRGGGMLTLEEYTDDLGGLQGAIKSAVDAAFEQAQRDPVLPHERIELEQLARTALIPALVHLDEADDKPNCRIERLNALPESTLPLVHHFVDQRLLVSDMNIIDGIATDTIQVAHEAILRQWPALRSWIAEERDALRALDGVRNAAREWRAHRSSADHGESWLVHGSGRLEEAEQLLAPPHFANALQPFERDYLQACRTRDNADREHERREIEREKKTITRTRRLQRNIFVLIGAGVIIASGAGWLAYEQRGEALDARDQIAQGESRLLTQVAADKLKDDDVPGAQRIILEVLGQHQASQIDRAATVSIFQNTRAEDRQLEALGHSQTVKSAAWSPDGTHIVTASMDGAARMWDVATGAQLSLFSGHSGSVNYAAFSPDGRRIVTASDDNTARVWDSATGAKIAVLTGHSDAVQSADFSPDGKRIVTASSDRSARIWNASTGLETARLLGHKDIVDFAVWSPDGRRIVTVSDDVTARIWDAASGLPLAVLSGHGGFTGHVALSPDGQRMAYIAADSTVGVWDIVARAQVCTLSANGHVQWVAFSPDGRRVVTGSTDKTARIWDAATGTQLAVLSGHGYYVYSAEFSPDGRHIVTASADKSARVWAAATSEQLSVLPLQGNNTYFAAFSPDARRIVVVEDKVARVLNSTNAAQLALLSGHGGNIENAAFSPDGRRVVTASDDKTARLWDAATGTQLAVLSGHRGFVWDAAFSSDGRRVVTASNDRTARVWDSKTGVQLMKLSGHGHGVASAEFSPDGRRIVTASGDKTARLWDAVTGTQLAVLSGHADVVWHAVFSPDGRRIVTASRDKTARIWDSTTGAQLFVLYGHTDTVKSAAFSPDGRRIVTASVDATARIWDAITGVQLAVLYGRHGPSNSAPKVSLYGHNGGLINAAFSPDGRRIITAAADGTARIWDARIPADLDTQIEWEEAAGLNTLNEIERSQLGLLSDPRVRHWQEDTSKCDQEAAAPYDPDRRAPGALEDQISADVAVFACTQAAAGSGHSPRFDYELGRALLAKNDVKRAANNFEVAASAGYGSARVDLANLLIDPSAKMVDTRRAVSLYEQAWQDGVAIAAFELGRLYEHGAHGGNASHVALRPNLTKAWFWYLRGANAGEPNALARLGERDDSQVAESQDKKKREAILLDAFHNYAAAVERAYEEDWPDDALKNWRYRRATLARLLAREGMMQQVADTYTAVRQRWQSPQPTFIERVRSWLP